MLDGQAITLTRMQHRLLAARVRPSGVMSVSGEGGPTQSLMKFPAAQFFITLYCVG
jgi:hypothetical protein